MAGVPADGVGDLVTVAKGRIVKDKPFVLRCISGPDVGRYFVHATFDGATWADTQADALKVSVEDAYGHVAAAIDMLCVAMVPENAGSATEDDYQAFAEIAAKDMFNPGGPEIRSLIAGGLRRSADQPFVDESQLPLRSGSYMSVWEWVARIAMPVMN